MATPPNHSLKLVSIPEDALAALCAKAGVDARDFIKVQTARTDVGIAFTSRAKAAGWSGLWLGCSTLFSLFCLLAGGGIEDLLATVLLAGMTATEFKVRSWFVAGDPKAAAVGYWNQTLFACLFLIYGAYHYHAATLPSELVELGLGPEYSSSFLQILKWGYVAIGIVGGGGQYLLARYYRRCR